jgi:hypothetical protein
MIPARREAGTADSRHLGTVKIDVNGLTLICVCIVDGEIKVGAFA